MPNKRFLFWYIFMLLAIWAYIYLSGLFWALGFIVAIVFYSLVSYAIHKVWKYIRKNPAMNYTDFLKLFIYKVSLYSTIVLVILGSFMYYQNSISPAQMPQYTLSNGEQTIVFQAMSHIASESFYQKVARDLRGYKQDGYVLYYEGVKPGSEENSNDFNAALGINFEPWLYENFSKLYGVVAQDNSDFLNLENNLDYNIDINIDEIMGIYRKKISEKNDLNSKSFLQSWEVQDVNSLLLEQLAQLNEKQLQVLRYINQSLLNFMIKQEDLRNLIVEKVANKDLFSVILDERNKHIVQEIESRWDEKIFIMYGLMHFQWVLELLQESDPNWQIYSSNYTQLITR